MMMCKILCKAFCQTKRKKAGYSRIGRKTFQRKENPTYIYLKVYRISTGQIDRKMPFVSL